MAENYEGSRLRSLAARAGLGRFVRAHAGLRRLTQAAQAMWAFGTPYSDDGGIALESMEYQWHYSNSEWDRHIAWQRRQALRGAIRSSVISVIACVGAVLVSQSWVAAVVVLLLTGWIPVMEILSANSSSKSLLGKPADSVVALMRVSYTHFVLGERVVRFDNRRILGAELNNSEPPTYLKIVHKGKMRRSNTLPELILVPEGKENEAQEIVKAFTELKQKQAKEEAAKRKPWQLWKRGV